MYVTGLKTPAQRHGRARSEALIPWRGYLLRAVYTKGEASEAARSLRHLLFLHQLLYAQCAKAKNVYLFLFHFPLSMKIIFFG